VSKPLEQRVADVSKPLEQRVADLLDGAEFAIVSIKKLVDLVERVMHLENAVDTARNDLRQERANLEAMGASLPVHLGHGLAVLEQTAVRP
jgi:dGTP triphosphohydrolase